MAKRNQYYPMKYFPQLLWRIKKNEEDFKLIKTTYTKKIITKDETIFFNEEGEDDMKGLLLIGAVRKDAKKYLEKNTIEKIYASKTDFFNLLDIVKSNQVIVKIDFKAAYWTYALDKGIITQQTNEKFLEWYENIDVYYSKEARLKAIGSLATTKFTNVYIKGRWHHAEPVYREPTRDLYMSICNGIDNLMKDVNYEIPNCVYYYWDCIFMEKGHEQQAIEYIKSRGYNVSVEETKLEFVMVGEIAYLLSIEDDKMYMVKAKDKHLIQKPQYEQEWY